MPKDTATIIDLRAYTVGCGYFLRIPAAHIPPGSGSLQSAPVGAPSGSGFRYLPDKMPALLLLSQCKPSRMHIAALLAAMALAAVQSHISPSHQAQKTYTVQGTLTHSYSYCGGVALTPEEEAEYFRQKPMGTKLYVRKGKANIASSPIIDSTHTNGQGQFSFSLPPGQYVIIMPTQVDKSSIERYKKMDSQYLEVDGFCVERWWKAGLFQIKVSDSAITGLDFNFHSRCFVPADIPCMHYNGPYPP
jgi:hypothetical protein